MLAGEAVVVAAVAEALLEAVAVLLEVVEAVEERPVLREAPRSSL